VTQSTAERGYARPELLADTEWLADRLHDPRVRIVDARGEKEYAEAHIPGAVHLDGFGGGIPRDERGDMGSASEWAERVGRLGISNGDTVVVYDNPSQRMGMVAWTFLYFGHDDVRILDGGVTKWLAEGRPLEASVVEPVPATYEARANDAVYCSLEDAKAGVARDDFIFWDTRSDDEFTGVEAGFRSPPGQGTSPERPISSGLSSWTPSCAPSSRPLHCGTSSSHGASRRTSRSRATATAARGARSAASSCGCSATTEARPTPVPSLSGRASPTRR
jgi:rhodanese-related sulfurtransferase